MHAEEHIMIKHRSVRTILIARVGKRTKYLPIDACPKCLALAAKRQIKIVKFEDFFKRKEL